MFGGRVQKLSINVGFTCPNRDGSKSTRGCAYCNNNTFRPEYCEPEKSVTQQINEGVHRFVSKYPDARFLAYFQSFSNTYEEVELLDRIYSEALSHPAIDGLVIGTRPDCVDDEVLDLIAEKGKSAFVTIEYGIESTLDRTLERINRHHTFNDTIAAVKKAKARNIHTGGHMILGLPGESKEDMLQHAGRVSDLQIDTLKLHQLQIVKNTTFAAEYRKNPGNFELFELGDYIDFAVDFLELLSPDIKVERFVNQSPVSMLIAPTWGMKNYQIVYRIEKRLALRDSWQGRFFHVSQC
jgi:radical SAM protein (TIGR01212 family)